LVSRFIGYSPVVTTNNCNTITDFHTTKHSSLISSVYLHESSRIYNTGTIKVSVNHTLPIPLHSSTRNVFKPRVKSSQADFLYSSIHLELTACLLVRVFLPLLLTHNCLEQILSLSYTAAERTWTYNKHISRDRYPASLLARRSDLQKTQLPLLLLVGPCLQSCCLTTR
jgi:hypothetical protein